MRFPHGPGYGWFGGILEQVIAGLFFLACFAVVVGLLVVLVRFLLVATKAAEIYVAKNSSGHPVAPAATTPTTTPPVASTTTTTPIATAPIAKGSAAARTRTPKTPPTV